MSENFIEELRWRGLLQEIMPGTEELLQTKKVAGYIGFDPTADSLHIGSLIQIIILIHFQKHGHTPIALLGGATGMIGDPSGKSKERNLLDEQALNHNVEAIEKQLSKFLDFKGGKNNRAVLVNNYDWMKKWSLMDFVRDIGKHLTVNYMMSKDSVKSRLGSDSKEGMSFTEFTYQLFQGYDFLHLFRYYDCILQMGGSDQWGNIVTGTELIRRKATGKAFALTCPLVTKSDGAKFGKTESGNIWLDSKKTSVYLFYQYWLNTSDQDAADFIKRFTFLTQPEIEILVTEHNKMPHKRDLQKRLARELTELVHGVTACKHAILASEILFGKSTARELRKIDENTFLEVFEGVPRHTLSHDVLKEGLEIVPALAEKSQFLKSNGEARRALKERSISVNKEKVEGNRVLNSSDLINEKYILLQRGKQNYFILHFE